MGYEVGHEHAVFPHGIVKYIMAHAGTAFVGSNERCHPDGPLIGGGFAMRRCGQPEPASGAHRLADDTVRVVDAVEEHLVGFDERLGQHECGGRVLRHQFAFDLSEPDLEFATELASVCIAKMSDRALPGCQRLAEARCQRLGLIRPLQPNEPVADGGVFFRKFEQDRSQCRRILLADEGSMASAAGLRGMRHCRVSMP